MSEPAGTWDYRVLRVRTGEHVITEAHYKGERLVAWTDAMQPAGDDLDELRRDLGLMLAALDRPVLDLAELEGRLLPSVHPAVQIPDAEHGSDA